jgi:rhamnosyltransferase
MRIHLFIPTLNAGSIWPQVVEAIRKQTYRIARVIVMDSGSKDNTLDPELLNGFDLIHLNKKDFDHGGTRQMAVNRYPDADLYLFLTQDAILADADAIGNLVNHFSDPEIGMAYGRQLPHSGAKVLETHARLFNYTDQSRKRSLEDAPVYGIKTISCSNSFAAYRKEAFEDAGGFPSGSILGEDVIIAGQMLLKGWKMAYAADAKVYHSHDYSITEEFKRYFDIGVFHADNLWIFESFGRAEGEGLKYLKSELKHVLKHQPLALPRSVFSLAGKYLGYRIGLLSRNFPVWLNKKFSMHRQHWKSEI